jgi:signal transduction histidine kinase
MLFRAHTRTEMSSTRSHIDDARRRQGWERANFPWYRRWFHRMGLQGKLVLTFAALLLAALAVSCWVFASQSSEQVTAIMGDQARQLSYALSMASKSSLEAHDQHELKRIGQDLLKARNVLFIAFLDPEGHSLALASRDPEFDWDSLATLRNNAEALTEVHRRSSRVLGEYLAVVAPVVNSTGPTTIYPPQPPPENTSAAAPAEATIARRAGSLLGYVVIGLSQGREQGLLRDINLLIAIVGALMVVLSLPLSIGIVYRIFQPIRELVAATRRIAAGDLETRVVAIHRRDVTGTLARSFNEMVIKVREQQIELEVANAALEMKVRERTAQLEAANKRLSSEIAEKEDFLRAVSHDLNAPLRNIAGMASMLLMKHRDHLDGDAVHRLERIRKNVEVETDLISELLELSRIKTRRQKVEVVDIDAMVRELGEVLEEDLDARGIKLILDAPLPALNCERARLRQVFQNLIDNAIKYMGADDPAKTIKEIHVGCTVRHSEIEFYVRDTGIGIEREDLDKVFFVFRRGKSAAVQNVSGKGVGLASVKSIIETYSGSIWVESEVGKGSSFRFTINGQHLAAAAQRDPPPQRRVA